MHPALHIISFRLPRSRSARVAFAGLVAVSISVVSIFYGKTRAWRVNEVPVAFWGWRTQTPADLDIRAAIEKANAQSFFLRAGQIDYHDGKLQRIRPFAGSLPKQIDVHLVYNATPALLNQLESVDPAKLATEISQTFRQDFTQATRDATRIVGLQLDIDVPTRLLPRYEQTLSALRRDLSQGTQLSITGLPTWMESPVLDDVLTRVDFWVPQFYGAEIPRRSNQSIPISSTESITHFVNQARQLDRPFYAGLAAYSAAWHYNASGTLLALRGDMDPAAIASDPNLELIDQRTFDESSAEWRYEFRAKADGVTQDLNMKSGDVLVIDVPTTESLRQAARIVRERGGRRLLGICVFRLPAQDDAATLTVEQVNSALNDQNSVARVDVQIKREQQKNNSHQWVFECKNTGTASSLVGTLKVDVAVLPGSYETIRVPAGVSVEPMCDGATSPQPCSQRRANLLRLSAKYFPSGRRLSAIFIFNRAPQTATSVSITMQTDNGQSYSSQREVAIDSTLPKESLESGQYRNSGNQSLSAR